MSYSTILTSFITETLFETFLSICLVIWLIFFSGLFPDYLEVISFAKQFEALHIISVIIAILLVMIGTYYLFAARHRRNLTEEENAKEREKIRKRIKNKFISIYHHIQQGLSIMTSPKNYLYKVASWQLLTRFIRLGSITCFFAALSLPNGLLMSLIFMAAQTVSTLLPVPGSSIATRIAILTYAFNGIDIAYVSAAQIIYLMTFMTGIIITTNVIIGLIACFYLVGSWNFKKLLATAKAEHEAHERKGIIKHKTEEELILESD